MKRKMRYARPNNAEELKATIRATWALFCMGQTLAGRSSESGFHRNVKFATFEEAGRLCKTIPQNGVKVAPLGCRSVPKLPH